MAKKVLITGGSGLIGTRLTDVLLRNGDEVVHLGRKKNNNNVSGFLWNMQKESIDPEALSGVDCIVHLAGAGVADQRWTTSRKKKILESRTRSTALLYRELQKGNHQVKSFISASGVGYYDQHEREAVLTEDFPSGHDFLAGVVKRWEEETDNISSLGVRVVKLRTGIVLSKNGGALKTMATPIRWWMGAALGAGTQYMSWIHIDDLCEMYLKAAADATMTGTYNAVCGQHVTNEQMTRMIAKVLAKPLWLPNVPPVVLRLMLGEMATMVLYGSKMSAEKILSTGFQFQYTNLETALADIFRKSQIA